MKILNRNEFLKLPEKTMFSYWEPKMLTGIMIKKETLYHENKAIDFNCYELLPDIKSYDEKNIKIGFDTYWREGLFEDNQLFAIYTKDEVKQMFNLIKDIL